VPNHKLALGASHKPLISWYQRGDLARPLNAAEDSKNKNKTIASHTQLHASFHVQKIRVTVTKSLWTGLQALYSLDKIGAAQKCAKSQASEDA
jgi:hypothetical protein